ncbi:MAG: hypothetical protein AAGC65_06495 [Mucilaginibacter sp.]|uniref:hypothetical protein n=1 Tax=Mucilaginibacter sp. TaxID=1882438 RepID=UPI00319EDC71
MRTPRPLTLIVLTLVLVTGATICWELFLRGKGLKPDYDDSPELWADKRARVYEPADKTTVFIGSSRIKYDLDVDTWQNMAGTNAIQLAMVGSSPRTMLSDLASDPNFKGNLIVDVTEILFFNPAPQVNLTPNEAINFYHKRTPAQKVSFELDKLLEPRLVMLDKDFYSLNGLLDHLYVPNRDGVYAGLDFPIGFHQTLYSRQNKMTDPFLADTVRINKVRAIWGGLGRLKGPPPVSGKALDSILFSVKHDVDLIRARGGTVLFLRTPSTGPFLMGEKMGYPKEKYWDKLLAVTQCKGIHFSEHASLNNLMCPEFSHLSPHDAVLYTKGIIQILKKENQMATIISSVR